MKSLQFHNEGFAIFINTIIHIDKYRYHSTEYSMSILGTEIWLSIQCLADMLMIWNDEMCFAMKNNINRNASYHNTLNNAWLPPQGDGWRQQRNPWISGVSQGFWTYYAIAANALQWNLSMMQGEIVGGGGYKRLDGRLHTLYSYLHISHLSANSTVYNPIQNLYIMHYNMTPIHASTIVFANTSW